MSCSRSTLGDNKMGAQMVVNNIESSSSGSTVTLKGDVTNNGLTDARSVLVTVGSPATPVNPNPVYAIGNLAPDDFSSFEVTYTQKTPGTVPIVVKYKDADGNTFTQRFTYDSNSNGADPGTAGSMPGFLRCILRDEDEPARRHVRVVRIRSEPGPGHPDRSSFLSPSSRWSSHGGRVS